ncbi:MAG: thioredoxin-disulfide reductase [Candidatus Absconditabacterales bacterium]
MENVVIIGSGPAGHTAAIYVARANLNPIMFEGFMAGGMPAGGQLTTTTVVENFPGFPEGINGTLLMNKMRQQSLNYGTKIQTKNIDKVDLKKFPYEVFSGDEMTQTKSIIIATGAIAKRLDIPGDKEYRQRGISACAICDGSLPIFKDKVLVVVGGGDVAIEEAIHLTHFASKVIVIVRRDVLRASIIMQDRALNNPKIEIMRNTEVIKAVGDSLLSGVKIINNQTKIESQIDCSGLFYAIGHKPNTDFLFGQLDLDNDGYIITKFGTTQTSVKGVFASGDVQDKKYRQAITSAGTGCMAALECEKYLMGLKS